MKYLILLILCVSCASPDSTVSDPDRELGIHALMNMRYHYLKEAGYWLYKPASNTWDLLTPSQRLQILKDNEEIQIQNAQYKAGK